MFNIEENRNSFSKHCANSENSKWESIIKRENELYSRENDIRSEFERDYNRVINTTGYRRMKHKTQVFFSPKNDHICTRIEHVVHVESISYTIAKFLGLNTELTKAIATAHDIGHSPFGHSGERILSEISQRDFGETFWHEKNGVNMVDNIELLDSPGILWPGSIDNETIGTLASLSSLYYLLFHLKFDPKAHVIPLNAHLTFPKLLHLECLYPNMKFYLKFLLHNLPKYMVHTHLFYYILLNL